MTRYKGYKWDDFLGDDDFVYSIIFPTEESRDYWNSMVENGQINIFEYTNAVLILTGWLKCNPQPVKDDIDNLWTRIRDDCRHEAGPVFHIMPLKMAFVVLATAFVFAVVLLFHYWHPSDGTLPVKDAEYHVITQAQMQDQVTILSKSRRIVLEDSNPEIVYDKEGVLHVGMQIPENNDNKVFSGVADGKLIVPYGKLAKLELSDGSRLWLNAGTSVCYPEIFPGDTRNITVDGEIYAEITSDGRPFVIHTKDVEVTVKGTKIDLSSYGSDDYSRVILIEGSVDVSYGHDQVSLAPKQAYTCSREGISIQQVDTNLYTSWIKGVYKFENEPIESVLVKLARHYNVTLVLPTAPSGVICYGSLELKDNISTVLSGLMNVVPFNFVIKNDMYYIQFN